MKLENLQKLILETIKIAGGTSIDNIDGIYFKSFDLIFDTKSKNTDFFRIIVARYPKKSIKIAEDKGEQ